MEYDTHGSVAAIDSPASDPHEAGVSPTASGGRANALPPVAVRGNVMRSCREGDRIWLVGGDGHDLGFVEIAQTAHASKVRLLISMDRAVRIERRNP